MDQLIEIYHRLLAENQEIYQRKFYADFKFNNRFIGIIGARGVGKTTFILQYLQKNYGHSDKALYVSGDHLYFATHTLLELVDDFIKLYNGELLCIDEIHKYHNWNQELKNIYDAYPQLKVIFSGSSSMDLMKGRYDLSRRVVLRTMCGFSFREFLEIKTKKSYPVLKFNQLVDDSKQIDSALSSIPKLLGYVRDYVKFGYYPIHLESKDYQVFRDKLMSVVDKTIFEDISSFYSLKTQNLDSFKKILYFFSTAKPGSINVNKISKSLGKDHATITEYIQILRDSGLLRFLLIDKTGHALVRNTEKIYPDNTNLLFAINETIGKDTFIGSQRELFVLNSLQNAGEQIFYTKNGDMVCKKYTFEIGGKNKTAEQIKGIDHSFLVKDDILIKTKSTIPMYLFGFLS